MNTPTTTDQIRKEITLRAPLSRVWRAISDASEFGQWFGMTMSGSFELGATIEAVSTHPECSGMKCDLEIARINPETDFAFRWKPGEPEPGNDPANEPSTLVEFLLEADADQTKLTVIESGFDVFPEDKRSLFYQRNEGGWTMQMENIRKYCEDA